MRFTLPQIRLFSIVTSLVILSFIAGWGLSEKFAAGKGENALIGSSAASERGVDLNLFWEVWGRLERKYFDSSKLDAQKMVYGAISGMVSAVGDPYTFFLDPDEQKRTSQDLDGEFEGVGIQIGFKGSRLAVIAPLDGSPAASAGVRAGDFIVGIKDEKRDIDMATYGITLVEAVDAIRGPSGSSITLLLTREEVSESFEVSIVRAKIEVPSVKLSYVADGKVAHLKLTRFGGQTDGEWGKAISEIASQNLEGMILDLRNNPGGYLQGSVDVVSDFISSGVVVTQEDGGGTKNEYTVSGKPKLSSIPIVVLINSGSASASEIVAAALAEHGRAKIVGEVSFGKGTIQEALEVGDSGLHVTTARWLTPKGTWINDKGVTPDVEIKDDPETEGDEQLEKAIELLGN